MLFFFCEAFQTFPSRSIAVAGGIPWKLRSNLARSIYELRLQSIYLSQKPEEQIKTTSSIG